LKTDRLTVTDELHPPELLRKRLKPSNFARAVHFGA
jgi:hypothetical protein